MSPPPSLPQVQQEEECREEIEDRAKCGLRHRHGRPKEEEEEEEEQEEEKGERNMEAGSFPSSSVPEKDRSGQGVDEDRRDRCDFMSLQERKRQLLVKARR